MFTHRCNRPIINSLAINVFFIPDLLGNFWFSKDSITRMAESGTRQVTKGKGREMSRGGLLCYAISQTVAFAIRTYVAAQTQSVRLSLPRLHDKLNTHHTNPHILANYDLQSASSLCNAVITGRDKHWSVLNVCVCVCVLVVLGYTDSQSLCMRQPRAGSMTPS